jgi:hypothetical protein
MGWRAAADGNVRSKAARFLMLHLQGEYAERHWIGLS